MQSSEFSDLPEPRDPQLQQQMLEIAHHQPGPIDGLAAQPRE